MQIELQKVKSYENVFVVEYYDGYVAGGKYNVQNLNTTYIGFSASYGTIFFDNFDEAQVVADKLNKQSTMNKIDYYENNADSYIETSKDLNMDKFNAIVEEAIDSLDAPFPAKLLDIGFGAARDMKYFKGKGLDIVGVDSCKKFVDNAKDMGLTAYQAYLPNLSMIPKEDIFDIIYSVGVLMHLDKKSRIELFKNIKKNLTPGGFLIISYNTLDRTNDSNRLFYKLEKNVIDSEVEMTLVSEEIIVDSRGIEWITSTFVR